MKNEIIVETIKDRDRTRSGRTFPGSVAKGHKAVIVPGESIVLFGETFKTIYEEGPKEGYVSHWKKFSVGDVCEFDSYNLHYLGKIVAISEKNVTVYDDISKKNRRLSLYEFDWRNYDFDLAETQKRNAETSQCI